MTTWQFVLISVARSHALKTSENSDVDIYQPPKFQTYLKPLHSIAFLENIRQFFELKGYTFEATETMSLISSLTMLHSVNLSKAKRQISLFEYFAETSLNSTTCIIMYFTLTMNVIKCCLKSFT